METNQLILTFAKRLRSEPFVDNISILESRMLGIEIGDNIVMPRRVPKWITTFTLLTYLRYHTNKDYDMVDNNTMSQEYNKRMDYIAKVLSDAGFDFGIRLRFHNRLNDMKMRRQKK